MKATDTNIRTPTPEQLYDVMPTWYHELQRQVMTDIFWRLKRWDDDRVIDCNECAHLTSVIARSEIKYAVQPIPFLCAYYKSYCYNRMSRMTDPPYIFPCSQCQNDCHRNFQPIKGEQ